VGIRHAPWVATAESVVVAECLTGVPVTLPKNPALLVPGFPTSPHRPKATYAAFRKESRMKFANAARLDRRSGGLSLSNGFLDKRQKSRHAMLVLGELCSELRLQQLILDPHPDESTSNKHCNGYQ
jgi:hypothetical protein